MLRQEGVCTCAELCIGKRHEDRIHYFPRIRFLKRYHLISGSQIPDVSILIKYRPILIELLKDTSIRRIKDKYSGDPIPRIFLDLMYFSI